MPVIIPPGFIRCSYKMLLSGDPEPMIVTAGWAIAAPINQESADTIAVAFASNMQTAAPDEVEFLGVDIVEGQDGDPTIWNGTVSGGAQFGDHTGTFLPPNCSSLVRKVTGLGGRRNRGRFYWPFTPEADCDQVGNLDADWRELLDDASNGWRNSTIDGTPVDRMVILHNVVSPLPTTVISLQTQSKLATQRRRLRP